MKELVFVCAVSDDVRMHWEIRVFLKSLRENGYINSSHILVYYHSPVINPEWNTIQEEYPESKIFFYKDEDNILKTSKIFNYFPIIRPYILKKHWEKHPYLEKCAIFYTDSDIIFLKKLDFSKFLNDENCYLSDTRSYLNSDYFDSKEKDVIPELLEEYKKKDVLNEAAQICGITRKIIEENKQNTGGAQYLLKNINSDFWERVLNASLTIRMFLMDVNQKYMKGAPGNDKENNGIQSWCADMFAVQWLLWADNQKCICPEELNFSWSTDKIEQKNYILHNAGITSDGSIRVTKDNRAVRNEKGDVTFVNAPAFFKRAFISSFPPKLHLINIITPSESRNYFTSVYAENILKSLYSN